MKATFAVYSRLDVGEPSTNAVETYVTFSRTNGKTDNIVTSDWAKENAIAESKWKEFSKFQPPLILGYGAGRHMGLGNLETSPAPDPTESLLQGTVELFDVGELLQQIDYASRPPPKTAMAKPYSADLRKRATMAARQKQVLLEMVAALLPEVERAENIIIYPPTALGSKGKSGVYVRTLDGEVRLLQLSFGYQTMMAWVVDIGRRLFAHYPKSQKPLHEPAIVLVDEIDLHLHPKWQRLIRERLTVHFPNVQFIATAHSPLMAQAYLDANLAVVMRKDNDHSIIDNDPGVVANWRVHQIVTSELFGLGTAWPPDVDALFNEQKHLLTKTSRTPEQAARPEVVHYPSPVTCS